MVKQNKLILLLILPLIFISCWKDQETDKSADAAKFPITEKMTWPSNLNDAQIPAWFTETSDIEERFKIISSQFQNHSDLIKSNQYKLFVDYVYEVFDKYKKLEWNKEKELAYLFDVLIPKIVVVEWVKTGKIDDEQAELIIQSIKRKDFNSIEDKRLLTEKFKIYLEEKNYNPFVKTLDSASITKAKTDSEEFKKIFLDPQEWIIYKVLRNRYDWNKTWIWFKPKELETEFSTYLNSKLENVFKISWIEEKDIIAKAYWAYWYASLEDQGKDILKDFKSMVQKYELDGKLPLDRYYRNDEESDLFKSREIVDKYVSDLSWWKKEEFEKDLKDFRMKMYLLSFFWKNHPSDEQWLWSSMDRSDFIDPVLWKWVQNLFRVSRYISPEPVKVNLNQELLK
ncbi:MAG: hypothetical protein ACD_2C00258G0006 [uncultured bacterium (gcode 4)]|uniref:Lipoprotein n=1 Tax=uncultured bacterium (gcode 4) TaxID=1234023 RepID=K2FCX6_9BACT|nr:MAG: hypothetical protein ACD_2C00258G0006 [uncultured bacterium (gcode 4)]